VASRTPLLGRQLMIRALAYQLQERSFGGLKPSTQRLLDRVCDGRGETALEQMSKARPGPGTMLIREWRGVAHRITVLHDEVVYRGRPARRLENTLQKRPPRGPARPTASSFFARLSR
jgi:Protein of unknown function (DUF2924)